MPSRTQLDSADDWRVLLFWRRALAPKVQQQIYDSRYCLVPRTRNLIVSAGSVLLGILWLSR